MAARRLIAERGLSQRHVCRLLEVDPKTVRRPERRGDEAVRARLRTLAGERRRFGYRRLGILLEREGMVMNHKKLYRLYREEGLAVRRRRGRKRATGTRAPLALPKAPDQRWSLDFVSDCLAARRFRILVVVDDFTRECLAAVADTSISGARVARELDALIARRGVPATIVSDNGPELTSRAVLAWTNRAGLDWHYIALASRSRTPSSRASSAGCGTSCSTRRSSRTSATPAACSSAGGSTTTKSGRTRRMPGCRRLTRGCSPRAPGLDSSMVRPRARSHRRKSGSKEGKGGDSPSQLIDARIKELSDWRGETLARVRILIKQADPEVVEEWKWRGVPVWSHAGIICTGETYKNVVKMTFAKGASLEDPSGLFNSSLEGNTRRAIDFHEGDKIDEKALKALIRAAVALNTSVRATARPVRSQK